MRFRILALLAVLFFGSCGENQYSTDYRCRLTFYSYLHTGNLIESALTPSSGMFVNLSRKLGTVYSLIVTDCNGNKETISITTEVEKPAIENAELGANNSLYVGCSFSNGAFCYDGQCPNCLASGSGYKYPLTFAKDGLWLYCSKCGRSYDLNNYGVVADGEGGLSLLRYRISYGGGVLNIAN